MVGIFHYRWWDFEVVYPLTTDNMYSNRHKEFGQKRWWWCHLKSTFIPPVLSDPYCVCASSLHGDKWLFQITSRWWVIEFIGFWVIIISSCANTGNYKTAMESTVYCTLYLLPGDEMSVHFASSWWATMSTLPSRDASLSAWKWRTTFCLS